MLNVGRRRNFVGQSRQVRGPADAFKNLSFLQSLGNGQNVDGNSFLIKFEATFINIFVPLVVKIVRRQKFGDGNNGVFIE